MGWRDSSWRGRIGWGALYALLAAIPVAIVAVLAIVVVPPVVRNLTSEQVAADTRVELAPAADGVSIVVPAGWMLQRTPGDDQQVTVRTPDGRLAVSVRARDESPARIDLGTGGDVVTETLASGLVAVHRIDAGELRAAVGTAADAGASAELRATAASDVDLATYLPAVAVILEGVEVGR